MDFDGVAVTFAFKKAAFLFLLPACDFFKENKIHRADLEFDGRF